MKDEDGDLIDVLVQSRRNRGAVTHCFRKLLKGQRCAPRRLTTDTLRGNPAAPHTVAPSGVRPTDQLSVSCGTGYPY
jgi:putative transposase